MLVLCSVSSSPLGLRLWGQEEEEEAEFQWNWAGNTEVHTFIVLWRRRGSALQAQGTSVGKPGSITYRA